MAGAGLIAIKRRIKSITNTRKITSAMNVVATSKLRKGREKLELNNKYYDFLEGVMKKTIYSSEESSIYKDGNKSSDKLYIVLNSDAGLCGGFNSEVVSKMASIVQSDDNKSFIIGVGQKGRSYIKRYNFETIAEYVDISDIPTTKEARVLADDLLRMYNEGKVGEVNIVYYQFISMVKRKVEVKKVLPLEKPSNNTDEVKEMNSCFDFEPNAEEILEEYFKSYITQTILNCMFNSKCSEQAARMEAMGSATTNANDLLDKLNTKYNRIRQSVITQELSEIVGGAEAQK